MTHPHEGLQERALREALERTRPYVVNVVEAHGHLTNKRDLEAIDRALSTPPVQDQGLRDALSVTDWLAVAKLAGENGIRYRTNAALERFLSALSPHLSSTLPQQAATDWFKGDEDSEGNPLLTVRADELEGLRDAVKSAQALALCCMASGSYSHEEIQEMARDTKPRFDAALSTPTSQPPAAETRPAGDGLDHLTDDQWQDMLDAGQEALCQIRSITYFDDEEQEAIFRAMFAALTQPEPTAQQATDEGEALQSIRRVLVGIEGNPKGDVLDREAAAVAMKLIDAIGKAG